MRSKKIAFVGGGNITSAIVRGLLADGYTADNVAISEPLEVQRASLSTEFPGVQISANNEAIVGAAGKLVLAVKPQIMHNVCRQLAATVQTSRPLILSVAAGVRSVEIDRWLGGGLAIIRVMPNQPALLRAGISGVYANATCNEEQLQGALKILSAVGAVVTVPKESQLDAVTAISGSGPAYFYLLLDMLIKTGVELGLDYKIARQLALETGRGSALVARTSDESMEDLVERISSPGGTTVAAIASLENAGIRDIFKAALSAARDRAKTLADQAQNSEQD